MPMLAEAARYRREAEKYRSRAARTADPAGRARLEDLARQLDELAQLAAAVKPAGTDTAGVGDVWSAPSRRRKPPQA